MALSIFLRVPHKDRRRYKDARVCMSVLVYPIRALKIDNRHMMRGNMLTFIHEEIKG